MHETVINISILNNQKIFLLSVFLFKNDFYSCCEHTKTQIMMIKVKLDEKEKYEYNKEINVNTPNYEKLFLRSIFFIQICSIVLHSQA